MPHESRNAGIHANWPASKNGVQPTVDAAQIQYEQGLIDQLPVIVAQQQKFDADRLLAQSEQTLLVNLVAVYKALGGGWEHAEPPPPPAGQDEEKD